MVGPRTKRWAVTGGPAIARRSPVLLLLLLLGRMTQDREPHEGSSAHRAVIRSAHAVPGACTGTRGMRSPSIRLPFQHLAPYPAVLKMPALVCNFQALM